MIPPAAAESPDSTLEHARPYGIGSAWASWSVFEPVSNMREVAIKDPPPLLSGDCAVNHDLDEGSAGLRWRIGLPVAAPVETFQFPSRPVL